MLTVKIEVLEDGLPLDGFNQGHISIRGDYGSVSTRGSVMIFLTLTALLDQVWDFLKCNKKKAELSLGVGSWFELSLLREKEKFSFTDRTGKIISKSTEEELTGTILKESERIYSQYSPLLSPDDSAVIGLKSAMSRFRKDFSQ